MKNKALLKRNIIFAAVLAGLYIIYMFVLTPIYSEICADIIYSEGALPYVLEIALEICQLLIWCHLFSHIISCFFFTVCKKEKFSVFIFVSAFILTALRYFAVPIITLTVYSADAAQLFSDAIYYFLFDIAQMAVVSIVSLLILNRKNTDSHKPIIKISAVSAFLITAVRIIMRIRFDIFYGAPESAAEIILMVIYYATDIFYGLIAYFLIMLSVKQQHKNKSSV
ncbi:MAG: hypothetical protein IJZ89_01140 [Clostridia bacterium]|nr:hypothetical protein [Clostridia bacterium]